MEHDNLLRRLGFLKFRPMPGEWVGKPAVSETVGTRMVRRTGIADRSVSLCSSDCAAIPGCSSSPECHSNEPSGCLDIAILL